MDRSNPDFGQIWRDRYERSCRDFQAGGSVHVLRASLFALDYIGARLEDEVRYQEGLRGDTFRSIGEAARKVVVDVAGRGGFTSGLPEGWR
jgi:hypothetical protein